MNKMEINSEHIFDLVPTTLWDSVLDFNSFQTLSFISRRQFGADRLISALYILKISHYRFENFKDEGMCIVCQIKDRLRVPQLLPVSNEFLLIYI